MARRPALQEAATPWGLLTSLDLYDCNPDTIRDADKIKQYVVELCTLIDMKRFGDCQVVHFGEEERVASTFSAARPMTRTRWPISPASFSGQASWRHM